MSNKKSKLNITWYTYYYLVYKASENPAIKFNLKKDAANCFLLLLKNALFKNPQHSLKSKDLHVHFQTHCVL